jgi:enoyl-CoA hydratase/carnithine racemase
MNSKAEEVSRDDEIRVLVITGSGPAFSTGADLAMVRDMLESSLWEETPLRYRLRPIERWYSVVLQLQGVDKPVIAAVNGIAVGGGLVLAMVADIGIASENATFGLVEPRIGVMPGAGGTQRLPRLIPLGIVLDMLFTAKRIDAHEAYHLGLISKVVPLAQLMSEAHQIAEQICQNAPLAVRGVKEAALRGLELHLRDGIALESLIAQRLMQSEDANEGIQAFLQKRKPEWKGR